MPQPSLERTQTPPEMVRFNIDTIDEPESTSEKIYNDQTPHPAVHPTEASPEPQGQNALRKISGPSSSLNRIPRPLPRHPLSVAPFSLARSPASGRARTLRPPHLARSPEALLLLLPVRLMLKKRRKGRGSVKVGCRAYSNVCEYGGRGSIVWGRRSGGRGGGRGSGRPLVEKGVWRRSSGKKAGTRRMAKGDEGAKARKEGSRTVRSEEPTIKAFE
jgi:hypothetical protein